jgi:hypothetical protein
MRPHATLAILVLLAAPTLAAPLPADFPAQHHGSHAALIRVTSVDTWLRIPREYGETFYFQQITAEVEQTLTPNAALPKAVTFSRADYRTFERGRMVLVGEEDVAFLSPATRSEKEDLETDWIVERDDLLPVQEGHISFDGHPYTMAEVREAIARPLDIPEIGNPLARLDAVQRGLSDDPDKLVAGLLPNILDAEREIAKAAVPKTAQGEPVDAWVLRNMTLQLILRSKNEPFRAAAAKALAASLPAPDKWSAELKFIPAQDAVTLVGPSRASFEVALTLARLHHNAARPLLWQALQARDFLTSTDPENPNSSSEREDLETTSRKAAARALGQLGDERVLVLKDPDLLFAALKEFPSANVSAVRAALAPWLKKPRSGGDPLEDPWYRARAVLARMGDDAALAELLANWDESLVIDPNIKAIDPARLHKPVAEKPVASVPPPTAAEREAAIREAIDGPEPERRARAMGAAGRLHISALHDRIVGIALTRTGMEQRAALAALQLYARPIAPEALQKLLAMDDIRVRCVALDLATAHEGPAYADAALAIVRAAAGGPDVPNTLFVVLPRLLQGGVPPAWVQGLDDKNPRVRLIFARAAAYCRVASLRPAMERHRDDPDPGVREAVTEYLRN